MMKRNIKLQKTGNKPQTSNKFTEEKVMSTLTPKKEVNQKKINVAVKPKLEEELKISESKTVEYRTPEIPPVAKPTVNLPKDMPLRREHFIEHMIKKHNLKIGCELGVWKGRTFLHLLNTCPDLKLFGVDLWAPQPENDGPENYLNWDHQSNEDFVRENSKKFGKRATIYKMWTHDAAFLFNDNFLDFVFIDADHSTEAVTKDLKAYWPKVKDNGWIFGHDINWPSVKKVADEFMPGYEIGPDNVWFRKKNV